MGAVSASIAHAFPVFGGQHVDDIGDRIKPVIHHEGLEGAQDSALDVPFRTIDRHHDLISIARDHNGLPLSETKCGECEVLARVFVHCCKFIIDGASALGMLRAC